MLIGLSTSICQLQRSGGPANLLAGLSWTPDANTTLSVAGGRARATLFQNSNPRIWKSPALVAGTYRYQGNVWGLGLGWRFRVSSSSGIPNGDIKEEFLSDDVLLDSTFSIVTPATYYLGVVAITSVISDFIEIQDNFSLTRVS